MWGQNEDEEDYYLCLKRFFLLFLVLRLQPQNLVLMGAFPTCDVKLCDFEISRVILEGTEIREILGTPDYVGE